IPALRLEGLYLALATFSLALAVPQILKYFEHWTGGSQGLVLSKPEAPFRLTLSPDQWLYFVALATLVLSMILAWNLLRGRTGRALIAIRDHHIAAEAMGVNSALYKSLAFGVSAGFTGVAGGLSAGAIAFVAPDAFNVFLSVTFLVGIVIGGQRRTSMRFRTVARLLAVALPLALVSAAVAADTPGVTATEIKIGNTNPYSGPASAYGTIGKAIGAYFKKVNDEGGINGRKINYISYDDAYSPPKAVEMVRKLVEQDQVAALFQTLGTPTNSAI